MDRVIVRTKLQAVVVDRMLALGLVRPGIHLVQSWYDDADQSRHDLARQCLRFSDQVAARSVLTRDHGTVAMTLSLFLLLLKARLRGDRVFLANLHWFPLGLALWLSPGMRIRSFDDGTANVQQRDNSFLSEQPSRRRGVGGWLSRRLFPKGVPHFVRSRIERHASIYPGLPNVVPGDHIDPVDIDWGALVAPEDRARMPGPASRIFLGSVYDELNAHLAQKISAGDVAAMVAWSDLHIPHPRQDRDAPRDEMLLRYPAEAVIAHQAARGPVTVAHFNSSVALSFRGDARITWVDLLEVPAPRFLAQAGNGQRGPAPLS